MNTMKCQRVLAWVFLCTVAVEMLSQSSRMFITNHHPATTTTTTTNTVPLTNSVRSVVSAFTISSVPSLSSSSSSCLIRNRSPQFMMMMTSKKFSQLPPHPTRQQHQQLMTTSLSASTKNEDEKPKSTLPFYLDPNTKGGVVVLTIVLFVGTYVVDQIFINILDYDEIDAGITIGMGFTVLSTLAWMSTYLFRVATKDMTYAKQLKDYENAVIAKRLEELDDDEIQALVEEVSKDSF